MLLEILLILCGLLYLYLKRKLQYWKLRNVPFKTPNLIFGNLSAIVFGQVSVSKYFENLHREFDGPYFGFFAFAKPWLAITDPDLVRRVLVKDHRIFPNRYAIPDETVDPLFINGLSAIMTPNWRWLRTKLSPVFTSVKVKGMLPLMFVCSENLLEYINANVDKSTEAKELAAKYSTDVITSCAFGITANSFVFEDSEFRVAARRIFEKSTSKTLSNLCYQFAPLLVKIFRLRFIDARGADFLRKVFNETIKQREEFKIKRNDLIDVLIKLKNAESRNDDFKFYGDRLVAQAVVFFRAGHETTSSVIAYVLHELCINNKIQMRLRMEINDIIERYGALTYEAIQDMKYLHMVICEALRKYPISPFLVRHCDEDYKIPGTELIIEKGTPILISQNSLHLNPKYFPNPHLYDPERFNPENKKHIPSCVYVPFGDGPRNCIGDRFALLSMKICIIQIVRSFSIERSADTVEPIIFGRYRLPEAKLGVFVTFKKLTKEDKQSV